MRHGPPLYSRGETKVVLLLRPLLRVTDEDARHVVRVRRVAPGLLGAERTALLAASGELVAG